MHGAHASFDHTPVHERDVYTRAAGERFHSVLSVSLLNSLECSYVDNDDATNQRARCKLLPILMKSAVEFPGMKAGQSCYFRIYSGPEYQ